MQINFINLVDESNNSNRKRPRTYLITDTPDHKQNSTIITTRQEKVKKRFSFQQFNSLPVVPDTPVKSKLLFYLNYFSITTKF
jgi:hypothetical protein